MFYFYTIKMWLLAFCFAALLFHFRMDENRMEEEAEEDFLKKLTFSTPN